MAVLTRAGWWAQELLGTVWGQSATCQMTWSMKDVEHYPFQWARHCLVGSTSLSETIHAISVYLSIHPFIHPSVRPLPRLSFKYHLSVKFSFPSMPHTGWEVCCPPQLGSHCLDVSFEPCSAARDCSFPVDEVDELLHWSRFMK